MVLIDGSPPMLLSPNIMLPSQAKIDNLNGGFFLIRLELYIFWFEIPVGDVAFVAYLLEHGETGTAPGMSACCSS